MKAAWSKSSIRSSFKVSPFIKSDHVHDHLRHLAIHAYMHIFNPLTGEQFLVLQSLYQTFGLVYISIPQQDLKLSSSETI